MTNYEYLDILKRKTMENVVVEEIREGKWKEKEEKWTKQVGKLGSVANWATWKCVEKHARVEFIIT